MEQSSTAQRDKRRPTLVNDKGEVIKWAMGICARCNNIFNFKKKCKARCTSCGYIHDCGELELASKEVLNG